jgi:hypothetical protein
MGGMLLLSESADVLTMASQPVDCLRLVEIA